MSKRVPGHLHHHDDGSSGEPGSAIERLVRVIESQELARIVPHVPPEALHRVVVHRGVEEAAPLLAHATPRQLDVLLDLDLWRPAAAGRDDRFDPARFGEWLEGLVESGDSVAADVVARMDRRLVVAGIASHVRVFDAAALGPASADGDWDEGAPFDGAAMDIGGYVVRARTTDAWDAIVAMLVALESGHRAAFHAVMRGCRTLSNSMPERDGLDDLPTDPQQLLRDAGAERDGRRAARGYLSPAEAQAFLQMARTHGAGAGPRGAGNPIVAAHLGRARDDVETRTTEEPRVTPPPTAAQEAAVREVAEAAAVVMAEAAAVLMAEAAAVVMAEEAVGGARPRALLAAPASRRSRVHEALEALRVIDEPAFLARGRELAFLANALVEGCSLQARAFSASEASDAALAACNLGLELWPEKWRLQDGEGAPRTSGGDEGGPAAILQDHDAIAAFEVGWTALHDASRLVADHLIAVLANVRTLGSDTHKALFVLRCELQAQCEKGTPWGARDALDVLASLDPVAWTALLGVLDECPVLPEALDAIVERRTGRVSATAFAFVSRVDQLERFREFGRALPAILAG